MKSSLLTSTLALVVAAYAALARPNAPAAQSKDEIQYQARLLDSLGQPINQSNVVITFRVYNFAVGGTPLHIEVELPMNITDGLLSARIGPLPDGLVQGPGDLYLGVQINSDAEMSPRLPIGSVPFALKAKEATLPPGMIVATGAALAPAGFLACDGSAVLRSQYPDLFAAIGVAYGPGDGVSTFNLPDLRQRFALGRAASGTGSALGAAGGAIDHAHAVAAHAHDVPAHHHSTQAAGADVAIGTSGGHSHPYITNPGVGNGSTSAEGLTGPQNENHFTEVVSHSHPHASFTGRVGLVTGGVSGDAPMTTGSTSATTDAANPPFQVVNFVIKT